MLSRRWWFAIATVFVAAVVIGVWLDHDQSANSSISTTPLTPTATTPRQLDVVGRLVIGGEPDMIPTILDTEGLLVDVATGNAEWAPDTTVVGLHINDQQVAYPVTFLSFHEVINDVVGEQAVVVTWCPLCFSAVVYDRTVDGEVLTFQVSGYLFNSNLVLENRRTNSLWSQLTGIKIRGGTPGHQQLQPIPFQLMTWAAWQTLYPDTRVISGRPWADVFDYSSDPYQSYYAGGGTGLRDSSEVDGRLPARDIVTGLDFDQLAVAVPFNDLFENDIIQLAVGSQEVVVFLDPDAATPLVYSSILEDGRSLRFRKEDAQIVDEQTGSIWDPQSGSAIDGPLTGSRLQMLPYRTGFWFSWVDHFPDTRVWGLDYQP